LGYDDRHYAYRVRIGPPRTPRIIKILAIANISIFVLEALMVALGAIDRGSLADMFGVSTEGLARDLYLWQPVTYMFFHADPFHLLINMLILWMFGADVATRLGPRTFLGLYLGAGTFAGICYAAFALFTDTVRIPCIGASGSIMGVIVFAGLLDPNRTVLFMLFFPMRLRTLVWVLVGLDLFYFITAPGNGVANSAHLGGALFGYLHFKYAHVVDAWFTRLEVKAEVDRQKKEADMRAEVDRLLAKISEEGISSLTEKEKRFLNRSSGRYGKKS
jgi:membrane associated rhomboid family serine protease